MRAKAGDLLKVLNRARPQPRNPAERKTITCSTGAPAAPEPRRAEDHHVSTVHSRMRAKAGDLLKVLNGRARSPGTPPSGRPSREYSTLAHARQGRRPAQGAQPGAPAAPEPRRAEDHHVSTVHSRMRAKAGDLLKVLNRARPQPRNPAERKTIT
ncbi:hypothetical protein MSG28_013353 [Choristoneura fumiferana]|uniref:Uncharacterized protein n=2 Tax=Choristoneura fumiferana TaxID=7141 RepID=A0ACC0KTW2_CHOFU|nr:hypothetical protein MSG28_013353 [Choristoneura fumiferana]